MTPHRGTTILVLGILSLVCCGPVGIFAWIMGKSDLAAIDSGAMDPAGRQMTNIGRILGIIGCVLFVFQIIWLTVFGGLAVLIPAEAPPMNG